MRLQLASLALERYRVRHALRYQSSDPTDAPWAREFGANPSQSEQSSASPWRPARQLELRVVPVSHHQQMQLIYAYLQGFADFVKHDHDAPLVRLGLIFHISRSRKGQESLAEMHQRIDWITDGLRSILEGNAALRPFVIGIDAAGSEQDQSPRNLSPYFKTTLSTEPTSPGTEGKWTRLTAGEPPIRLRRTCHAGEDFPDLLTGLRWMDETVQLFKLRPGERLGHGLALAWEPRAWYARKGPIYKPLREHFLDLIWVIYTARTTDRKLGLERNSSLDDTATSLFEQHSHDLLGDAEKAMKALPDILRKYREIDSEEELLTRLSLWQALQELEQKFVEVEVDENYQEMVEQVRARVKRRISKGDIILELCPSSNFLIGGFERYADLPYLSLNRTGLHDERSVEDPIMISLNTDNPGNFKTTLTNEYRLMGNAIQAQGYRLREAARWLEEAREVGLASSFIPPWSPPTKQELLTAIKAVSDPSGTTYMKH